MKTLYDIAKQYFDENGTNNITIQTLADFLQENEWRIYDHYDKNCKRCDIKTELEERELEYTDKNIDDILYYYEDYLSESDEWRNCLNMAIEDVLGV